MNSKREPDHVASVEQLGQLCIEFSHGKRCIDAQRIWRIKWTQSVSVPDFAFHVLGLAKKRGAAVGRNDQPGLGFREPTEVMEIAVVAVDEIAVAVARLLWRRGNDGDSVLTELGCKRGTPLRVGGCDHGRVQLFSIGGLLSRASRSGVPTSVQLPVYSSAVTLASSMAARNMGASLALTPCGLPTGMSQ